MYLRYQGGGVGHCRSTGAIPSDVVINSGTQEPAPAERAHTAEEDILEEARDIPNAAEEEESNSGDSSESSVSDGNGSLFEDEDEGMDSCDAD
jgi:hypothetical protein